MNGFTFLTIASLAVIAIAFGYIHFRRKAKNVSRVPGPLGAILGFVAFIIVSIAMSIINSVYFTFLIPLTLFILIAIVILFALRYAEDPETFTRVFIMSLLSSFIIYIALSNVAKVGMD